MILVGKLPAIETGVRWTAQSKWARKAHAHKFVYHQGCWWFPQRRNDEFCVVPVSPWCTSTAKGREGGWTTKNTDFGMDRDTTDTIVDRQLHLWSAEHCEDSTPKTNQPNFYKKPAANAQQVVILGFRALSDWPCIIGQRIVENHRFLTLTPSSS